MHRSLVLFALASVVACSEGASTPATPADPSTGVTSRNDTIAIAVNPANVGPIIPSNFIGLSWEAQFSILQPGFRRNPTPLVNVMKAIGTGVVRIGGSSIDRTWWSPGGREPGQVFIGADFDSLSKVVTAANWTVVLGVNFAAALPDTFAAEAAFIKQHLGSRLAAIELGNEPDIYAGLAGGSGGLRPATYNFAAYAKELDAYLAAFQQRAPGVPIAAPSTSYDTAWLRQTIAHAPSRFALATQHRYSVLEEPGIPASNFRYPTITNLMSDTLLKDDLAFDKAAAAAGSAQGVPVRLDEWGPGDIGVVREVSNTFASSLWALDHTFAAAEAGLAGVNFSMALIDVGAGTPFYFKALDGTFTPLPQLYGILAFQDAARGRILNVTATSKRRWNVSPHGSVDATDGTVRLALVNKDTASLSVRIVVPNAASATVRRLAASSPTAPFRDSTGVTYAGAAVSTSGTFTAATSESITPIANTFVINVPFASAAIVIVTTK
jgi:hypothetical protein